MDENVLFSSHALPGFKSTLTNERRRASVYVSVWILAFSSYAIVVILFLPMSLSDKFITVLAGVPIFLLSVISRYLSLRDLATLPIKVTTSQIVLGRRRVPIQGIRQVRILPRTGSIRLTYSGVDGRARKFILSHKEVVDTELFVEAVSKLGIGVLRSDD